MKKMIVPIVTLAIISLIFPLAQGETVPDWVKNTAGWWATDAISETEFVNAIEFLVNQGIIEIENQNECVNDISKYFSDKEKIIQVCKEHKSSFSDELIPYDVELKFNSKGFRGEEFSEEKSSNVYRIFMVGGSTMLGAEVTNDTTIPSILQKMFDSQDLDREIEVINAGVSGGNSATESKMIQSKIVNYDPDLVIIYDGWNDISADYPVMLTVRNWESVCLMAIKNNFNAIITLQPIAGFGNKILTEQERINSLTGQDHNGFQLLQAKSSYEYLARELEMIGEDAESIVGNKVCMTEDLSGIFDHTYGSIYWDQGHVLHAGNLILAEKFFEISMDKIDPSFVPDRKFGNIISQYNSIPVLTYLFDKIGLNGNNFDNEFQDIMQIKSGKGAYFELKQKFEDGSEIFVGRDFRDVDLKNIKLDGHDLTGANLSGQDLRDVDLSNIIIRGANLSYTNLEGKDFSDIDIRGVNFSNANMKNADLSNAKFAKSIQYAGGYGQCGDEFDDVLNYIKKYTCVKKVVDNESIRTNFSNADLQNAKFIRDNEKAMYFFDFSNADLSNAKFERVEIIGSNFENANLDNTEFENSSLINNNFENAKMRNFEMNEIWSQFNNFENAKMTDGVFNIVGFIQDNFNGTDLDMTEFAEVNFSETNLNCKNNEICD